ncbi:MAG: PEGA domain-containing protein [Candidatus Eremiobacteraeota bacterium]|nr:PEGA domain-containing protein [Candidatus Eremiobacteraeota bacterium]
MIRSIAGRLLVVALIAGALAARASAGDYGSLYLSSLPGAADVWVDGSYIGRTPVLLTGLKAGRHTVTVTKTGWKVSEDDQQISVGVTTMASVQLDPLRSTHPPRGRGQIAMHGLKPDARVSFDGGASQVLRQTYDEPVGTHNVVVREPKERFDRTVEVYPNEATHVLYRSPLADTHNAVVAPASDYFPEKAAAIGAGGRLVIHWGGHRVIGRIGDARFSVDRRVVIYDAPAGMVRGKLYLPLDLILAITGGKSR